MSKSYNSSSCFCVIWGLEALVKIQKKIDCFELKHSVEIGQMPPLQNRAQESFDD